MGKRYQPKKPHRWKPEGYTSVSPYLIVDGAQQVIDFLVEVFNARELRRYDMPDGSIMHAELVVDDSILMIGDSGDEWLATEGSCHVYVEDVDQTYERALAAGGTSVERPQHETGDPDRRGGVRDPGGNVWWIATRLTPTSLEAS